MHFVVFCMSISRKLDDLKLSKICVVLCYKKLLFHTNQLYIVFTIRNQLFCETLVLRLLLQLFHFSLLLLIT